MGRDSAPQAHLMYLTTAPITSVKYCGLLDATLIEIRGLSPKKHSSQITIVPPGIHQSGERITFAKFDAAAFAMIMDAEGLAQGVKHAAIALAILQVWRERGKRHDARLAFSKVLHEADLPDVICQTILVAVNRVTRSDVSDVAQCFGDTIKKDAKDTKGASWIADNLEDGAATLKVIEKIGRKARIPEGTFDVTEMDLKALTPSVWTRLAESNTPIRRCLQGGIPVRAVHVPENSAKRRPTWVFQPLEADKLRNEVAQIASFHELRAKTYRQVVPPRDLVRDMLATPPERVPLPIVTRITYAPTMADDGTIALAPQSVAMKLTGHKTDSVFRRYDIVSPDDLRVAVERLDAAAVETHILAF